MPNLGVEVLRVLVGAGDDDGHLQVSSGLLRLSARLGNGGGQLAGGVGVSAVAQHHIEHDDRHLRVLGLLVQASDAEVVVHHWVQTPHSELVLPQVHDGVSLADHRVLQSVTLIQRSVGIDDGHVALQDELGLVGQGAAGEEPTQVALSRREAGRINNFVEVGRPSSFALRPLRGQLHRQLGGLVESLDKVEVVHLPGRSGVADELHHHRLARLPGELQHLLGHLGCRRFGDEDDDPGFGVTAEQIETLAERHRPHLLRKVSPAGAQTAGDAAPQLMDARGHLLQPGPGRRDHANRSPAHPVGEP